MKTQAFSLISVHLKFQRVLKTQITIHSLKVSKCMKNPKPKEFHVNKSYLFYGFDYTERFETDRYE